MFLSIYNYSLRLPSVRILDIYIYIYNWKYAPDSMKKRHLTSKTYESVCLTIMIWWRGHICDNCDSDDDLDTIAYIMFIFIIRPSNHLIPISLCLWICRRFNHGAADSEADALLRERGMLDTSTRMAQDTLQFVFYRSHIYIYIYLREYSMIFLCEMFLGRTFVKNRYVEISSNDIQYEIWYREKDRIPSTTLAWLCSYR